MRGGDRLRDAVAFADSGGWELRVHLGEQEKGALNLFQNQRGPTSPIRILLVAPVFCQRFEEENPLERRDDLFSGEERDVIYLSELTNIVLFFIPGDS
jgi:hypothetical protein